MKGKKDRRDPKWNEPDHGKSVMNEDQLHDQKVKRDAKEVVKHGGGEFDPLGLKKGGYYQNVQGDMLAAQKFQAWHRQHVEDLTAKLIVEGLTEEEKIEIIEKIRGEKPQYSEPERVIVISAMHAAGYSREEIVEVVFNNPQGHLYKQALQECDDILKYRGEA